jgi:hypothetical protein
LKAGFKRTRYLINNYLSHHKNLFYLKNLVFCLLLFAGCTSQVINLSVLEPAEIPITPKVKAISMFPAVGYQTRPGQFDSLSAFSPDTTCDYNKVKQGYLFGIHEVLSRSPRFSKVKITDTSFIRKVTTGSIDTELIRRICQHDTTDAVFLILKVVAYDFPSHLNDDNYTPYIARDDQVEFVKDDRGRWVTFSSNVSSQNCVFLYRLITNFKIGVFRPEDFAYPDFITLSDVFDMVRPGECNKFNDKKSQKELLYNSCYFSGNQVGNRLIPLWKDNQKRALYKDINPYLLEGNNLALRDNWNAAAELWVSLAYKHRPRVESRASYNLAIKSEREDDLDNATFWINRADSIKSAKKIKSYRSVLEERMTKRALLDQQMR